MGLHSFCLTNINAEIALANSEKIGARQLASPGIKGGHFSDAACAVSSKHLLRPTRAYKLLIVLGRCFFFTTFFYVVRCSCRNSFTLCEFRSSSFGCRFSCLSTFCGSFESAIRASSIEAASHPQASRLRALQLIGKVLLSRASTIGVMRKTGAGRNQAPNNNVLFQAAQIVTQSTYRCFGENTSGFLE